VLAGGCSGFRLHQLPPKWDHLALALPHTGVRHARAGGPHRRLRSETVIELRLMVDRREQRRAALMEKARQSLRGLEQQLDKPDGSRIIGTVNAAGDPSSLMLQIEVPLDGRWVILARFSPQEVGMTDDEMAEEAALLQYQSGVGIPDDASSLDPGDETR
jgi:hypothetical protein